MATIRILLGIICLAFASGLIKSGSDFLERFEAWKVERLKSLNVVERTASFSTLSSTSKRPAKDKKRLKTNRETTSTLFSASTLILKRTTANDQRSAKQEKDKRQQIIAIAKSQIGVRETSGKNDGIEVEKYLAYTGNKKGEPWCASFVSWIFGKAGCLQPKSAWSPALFPNNVQAQDPTRAMVFGIYYPKIKRIAHCGLVSKVNGNWIYTIEGNTNVDGSREGDGVYQRIRHQRIIKVYADWLKENGGTR